MFFNEKINGFNSQIKTQSENIKNLEAELQRQREQLKKMENYLQSFQTADSAAESGYEQVAKAIQLLGFISPSSIQDYQDRINELFEDFKANGAVEQPALEAEVEAEVETENKSNEETNTVAEEDRILSYRELHSSDIELIRAIARMKGISTLNKTKSALCRILKNKVKESEVKSAIFNS